MVTDFFRWQYGAGIAAFLSAWANIHWFLFHFFSVPVLIKSFFAPFHRLREKQSPGFNPEELFEVFMVNILMRAVGMVVRSMFIAFGVAAELLAASLGAFLFTAFLVLPLLALVLVVAGIIVIFT